MDDADERARRALIDIVKLEAPILPEDVCSRAVDRMLIRLHMAGFAVTEKLTASPERALRSVSTG